MSQAQMISVLIVDDHTIVRRGIKALLAQSNDIQVIGEADNGLEAIRLSKELEPDVILMDLLMPKMDGIEATRQITARQPNVHVLVMTSFIVDEKIIPAIKAGALGCLLKDSEPWELVQSIYRVHRGEPSFPSSIARKMMKDIPDAPTEKTTPELLTSREVDVLQLLARGLSNDDVAVQLTVPEPTVRTHMKNLKVKLQLVNRVQAALYALRNRISTLGKKNERNIEASHATDSIAPVNEPIFEREML